MSQVSSCSVAVPPHYFYSEGEADVINGLPNEIVSSVLDFADYGMLARLSCTSKPFRDILTECAESRFDLAVAFLNGGGGLEKNASMAVRHLRQIVSEEKTRDEEELTRSKYLLAQCYLTGNGIEKDLDQGLSWLEDAASVGDAVSAHYLATLYENGEFGVDLCPEKAASWFLFAAKLGHSESMAEYALHCELGVGVDQSDTEALDWYLKAAAAGHVEANFSIGECYEEAKGVPHDLSEACLWYFKSAQSGCNDSLKALKRLQDIARIVLPGVGRIFGA